jgi:uncharacterized protein YkwD
MVQGNAVEARVLLEEARMRGGDSPEINTLLSYLLEREGKVEAARQVLTAIENQSVLASAMRDQLSGPPGTVSDIVLRKGSTDNRSSSNRVTGNRAPENRAPEIRSAPNRGNASTSAVTATSVAALSQNDVRLEVLESFLAGLVNDARKKAGLRVLVYDSLLADTARAHSSEMRDRRYFAHESPNSDLREPMDRYRAVFKRTPTLVAENVYRSWGSPRRVNEKHMLEAHDALMKSPGHHANIVLPEAVRIGIGLVTNENGDIWVTQMFARG